MILEGLNTQARHWSETITIQDDGSLNGLEFEVEQFKYLKHRPVDGWEDPNIVLCFMDHLSQNRASERLLSVAATEHRPAFIISTYDGNERIAP